MQPLSAMDEAALRRIIEETVMRTLGHVGFTVDAPNEIQADLIYVRKARQGADEVVKWVRRASISAALSAALYSVWQGIRHGLERGVL